MQILLNVIEISGLSQAGGPHFLEDQLTLSQPGEAHYPYPEVQSKMVLRNFLVTTKKFLKVKSSLFQKFNQSIIGILDKESRENG